MQSRVVTGLLTRHNTLRRHLCIVGLIENSLCRRWGAEEKISAHVLCESETLAIFRHYRSSFFLDPEDDRSRKVEGSPELY